MEPWNRGTVEPWNRGTLEPAESDIVEPFLVSLVTEPSSATIVRDLVAAGDRRRRQRAVARTLSRVVPIAAVAVLLAGVMGSALGWSLGVTATVWIALAAGVSIWAVLRTRLRPTTDAIALAVDEDAGLAGELRSAHWFSSQPAAARGPHSISTRRPADPVPSLGTRCTRERTREAPGLRPPR